MANINAPKGFSPSRYLSGAPWNGMATPYYIPATDASQYGIGDAVKTAAGGDPNGIPQVQKALGTDTVRGIVVGVLPIAPVNSNQQAVTLTLEVENIPATKTKAYYVLVVDDPKVAFELVDDGLTVLTATACNKNASFTVANPAAPQTNSASVLTTGSIGTVATLNLKMLGLVQNPTNAYGAYARWLVMFNLHELGGPATVGV